MTGRKRPAQGCGARKPRRRLQWQCLPFWVATAMASNGWLAETSFAGGLWGQPQEWHPMPVRPPPEQINRPGAVSDMTSRWGSPSRPTMSGQDAWSHPQPTPPAPRPEFNTGGRDPSVTRPAFSPPAGLQPGHPPSSPGFDTSGTRPSFVRPVFPSDHPPTMTASRPAFGSPLSSQGSGWRPSNQGRPEFLSPTQNNDRALFREYSSVPQASERPSGEAAPSAGSYHTPWSIRPSTAQLDLATHSAVTAANRTDSTSPKPASHGMAFSPGMYEAPPAYDLPPSSLNNRSTNSLATNNAGNLVGSVEQANAHTLSLAGKTVAGQAAPWPDWYLPPAALVGKASVGQATPSNLYGTALSTLAGLAPGGYGLGQGCSTLTA